MSGTAVVSDRGAARWLDRQHPWIYRSDVIVRPGAEADVVRVVREGGEWIGRALWSPASTIALRMLTRGDEVIDDAFWGARVAAAVAYRAELAPRATAYRLIHGEADGLPSLVVDRYGDVLVAQFLSAGLERCREPVVAALREAATPSGILARNDVPVRAYERLPRETELLYGVVPRHIEVEEAGIRYIVALWTGQKTGAFLDQRENRARAGELGRGRALDCFSYHGSFALHLGRAAREVVAVDSSGGALERARANAALNGLETVRTVEANVFDFLRAEEAAGARYDVVVIDPPAFAKRREAVNRALRGYKEVNLRAMRLLAPGGHLLTFSCSYHVDREHFHGMLASAAADAGRPLRWLEWRGQAPDHPEILQIPETGYLKGAVLQAV